MSARHRQAKKRLHAMEVERARLALVLVAYATVIADVLDDQEPAPAFLHERHKQTSDAIVYLDKRIADEAGKLQADLDG